MFRIRTLTQRERLRQALYPYYRLSAPFRPLPNALIIGGMKCGTTTLNAWLREHPQVAFSSVKEIHFFDKHYAKGAHWYRTHFPIWEILRGAHCRIEATPSYLSNAIVTAPRMSALIPNAKLIAMLRNPVERAISHYCHLQRNGIETRPPEIALTAEVSRSGRNAIPYKERGLYAQQLEAFMEHYSREKILIIKSEEFFKDPEATFLQTQLFLNLNPIPHPKHSPPKKHQQAQNRDPKRGDQALAGFLPRAESKARAKLSRV
ncbi:sulfotransferase [Synechococcus sp. CB0101]|uniref:sulfotransferase family protein n=1 Tax=Synechococcus sp. CB0101 TaxID=232348 RepID=UPI0002001FA6|nr:sulfotransferase [Synechococcus sp. CB0101]QCH15789.1 sulfotransferase [Synechococcus sp. CB0101]